VLERLLGEYGARVIRGRDAEQIVRRIIERHSGRLDVGECVRCCKTCSIEEIAAVDQQLSPTI
jgi:hypothetical protein